MDCICSKTVHLYGILVLIVQTCILVNGAGLAMATMDIIKLHKGEPSNFLDLGGGVQEEGVLHAFKIVSQDPRVCTAVCNNFIGAVFFNHFTTEDSDHDLANVSFQVRVILVNIFAGIVDCAVVANGIVSAYEKLKLDVPIVVRLEGKKNALKHYTLNHSFSICGSCC